jgi:predicted esterase
LKDLIGGVIVCSGILFPQGEIVGDKNKLNVHIGHGDKDLAIPLSFHNETIERIEDYEGLQRYYYKGHGHSISDQEKKDIENFLNETM